MATLFDIDFADGTLDEIATTYESGVTLQASTDQAKNDSYSMEFLENGGNNRVNGRATTETFTALGSGDDLYVRFYMYIESGAFEPTGRLGVCLLDDGPTHRFKLELEYDASGDVVQIWETGYSLFSNTNITWTMDAWNWIEVHFVPHASTGGAQVWVNGTSIYNSFSSDTSSGIGVDRVMFGNVTYGGGLAADGGGSYFYDAMVGADTGPIGALSSGTDIDATLGSLTLSGFDAAIGAGSGVAAALGSLTLSGFDSSVGAGTGIDVDGPASGDGQWDMGAYIYPDTGGGYLTLSGYNATVTAEIVSSIDATLGSFTLTGQNTTISAGTDIDSALGSLTLSGFDAAVSVGTDVDASLGSLTLTGHNATVDVQVVTDVDVTLGSLGLSGLNPDVSAGSSIAVSLGSLTLSGLNATVSSGSGTDVALGSLSLSRFNAAVSAGASFIAGLGSLSLSGLNASVGAGEGIDASVGLISLSGFSANISAGKGVAAALGQLSLSGLDASVISSSAISSGSGQMSLTGYNADISTTYDLISGDATLITLKAVIVP